MSTFEDYVGMQKRYYENPELDPKVHVVGNYGWHQEFPYEQYLLNRDGVTPLFESLNDKLALDFGCGPGRMIKRMQKLFKRVDGADISQRLLDLAKEKCPEAKLYQTNGYNVGGAADNTYDFVYSTISMQHIASNSVRMKILADMKRILKSNGCVCLQMGFNHNYNSPQHAHWREDRFDARGTNSACDVVINDHTIDQVEEDFNLIGYKDFSWWLCSVYDKFDNLNGQVHPTDYWPTHWIFLNAWK